MMKLGSLKFRHKENIKLDNSQSISFKKIKIRKPNKYRYIMENCSGGNHPTPSFSLRIKGLYSGCSSLHQNVRAPLRGSGRAAVAIARLKALALPTDGVDPPTLQAGSSEKPALCIQMCNPAILAEHDLLRSELGVLLLQHIAQLFHPALSDVDLSPTGRTPASSHSSQLSSLGYCLLSILGSSPPPPHAIPAS